jgi:hypothetical protein
MRRVKADVERLGVLSSRRFKATET